jgi:choline dehydrogenase-like flavoprotein
MPSEGFAQPLGAYWCPTNLNNVTQTGAHSHASYYDPVQNRTNLKLLPNTKVTQIIFDTIGGLLVATGVEMLNNNEGSMSTAYACKEVVLAAGGIFTPYLLMVSGIGPKDILTAVKVPVKLDAPGVGSNFQDHPTLYQMFTLSNQSFPNPSTLSSNATFYSAAEGQYYAERQGPWTYLRVSVVAFLPLKQWAPNNFTGIANQVLTQKMTNYLPASYSQNIALLAGYKKWRNILVEAYLGDNAATGEVVIAAWGHNTIPLEKPLSRGTITLNTTDPTNLPVVQWNALQNPAELKIIAEMIRFSRRHWARPEPARYSPVEYLPGTQYQANAELIGSTMTSGLLQPTFAHLSCSRAMMPQNLGGVVSDQLLVYGVRELSIIDASITPLIPATHLQATMYAVSEKASDIIKARHGY